MLIRIALFVLTMQLSLPILAQNTWGPITRPLTRLHSAISPNGIAFENNLMNHISDELRLDSEDISKFISCHAEENGQIVHRKGGRVIPVTCYGHQDLDTIRTKVGQKYGHHIGSHLKYAVRSGNYIFAVCNYDEKSDHSHSKDHYVCRTPLSGLSKINNSETFCYKMSAFHRTCNPHKALVSTEIILINSTRRWPTLDKSILTGFLKQNSNQIKGVQSSADFIEDISNARVLYSERSRGSADSSQRFPKNYVGKKYICIEDYVSSDNTYLKTKVQCGPIQTVTHSPRTTTIVLESVSFESNLERVKQTSVHYPMISPERSSVD